jgi:hypothetical protein
MKDFAIQRPKTLMDHQSIIPDTQLRRSYLGPRPSFPALSIEGECRTVLTVDHELRASGSKATRWEAMKVTATS